MVYTGAIRRGDVDALMAAEGGCPGRLAQLAAAVPLDVDTDADGTPDAWSFAVQTQAQPVELLPAVDPAEGEGEGEGEAGGTCCWESVPCVIECVPDPACIEGCPRPDSGSASEELSTGLMTCLMESGCLLFGNPEQSLACGEEERSAPMAACVDDCP